MYEQLGKPQEIKFEPKLAERRIMLTALDKFWGAPDIVEATARLYDIDLQREIGENLFNHLEKEFRMQEMKEVTSKSPDYIAHYYTKSIFEKIKGSAHSRTYNELLLSITSVHQEVMPFLTPLLVEFIESVMNECEQSGIKRLVFLSRDGNILYVIAQSLNARLGYSMHLELAELNRRIVGIPDEFIIGPRAKDNDTLRFEELPDLIRNSPANDYIESLRLNSETAVVDVGVYGTIIGLLRLLGWKPWVFFLVSKNRFIRGHIDTVNNARNYGCRREIPMNLGSILADIIEALAKTWGTVSLSSDYDLKLSSERIPAIYGATGMLALWAASAYAKYRHVSSDIRNEIRNLSSLWRTNEVQNTVPLFVMKGTPKWSQAPWFIKYWERMNIGYVRPDLGPDPT